MHREQRLRLASKWYNTYKGKNPVRGYAKRFDVDLLCAIVELRLSGVVIAADYEEAVKRSFKSRALYKEKQRSAKQKNIVQEVQEIEHDWNLSFIAGYTPGGAPYGLTWEEQNPA